MYHDENVKCNTEYDFCKAYTINTYTEQHYPNYTKHRNAYHIPMILEYALGIDWMKSNLNYSNNNEYTA